YEAHQSFEDVYQTIVDRLLELAQQQDVIYAVPGHPYVAETTTMLLLEAEKQRDDVSVNVLGGKSFIDDIFAAVKIDPNDG
ncbi:SAM-dependent methyltransferase, partial [Staphylococcus warneri]